MGPVVVGLPVRTEVAVGAETDLADKDAIIVVDDDLVGTVEEIPNVEEFPIAGEYLDTGILAVRDVEPTLRIEGEGPCGTLNCPGPVPGSPQEAFSDPSAENR